MAYTLEQAQNDLANFVAARSAILTSQEYSIGSRRLVRADLAEINREIARLNAIVSRLERGGGIRAIGGTPL